MKEFFAPRKIQVQDPPFAQFLFNNTAFSLVWLVARLWVASIWLQSGWGKITNPKWVETGEALQGFWLKAAAIPEAPAQPAIYFDWYRQFIQFLLDTHAYTWFAKFVAYGEIMIGIALALGAFVGIAAFFGAFMNWNFIMAGTASSNPMLLAISIFLILAWKTAGYYGLDRYLLPMLGTPWQVGYALKSNPTPQLEPLKA